MLLDERGLTHAHSPLSRRWRHLLGRIADGRAGVDYEAVLQADKPVTSPLDGQPVVLLRQFGGDGSFSVFGEYEDGELISAIVDFVEPDEWG
jgi:hypothetical protein